jgi:hypothetical protein
MTFTIQSNAASSALAEPIATDRSESASNQSIVQQLASREVFYCVSGLVSTIAAVASEAGKFGDTDNDEIIDLFRGMPDYEEAAREEGWEVAEDQFNKMVEEVGEPKLRAIYDAVLGEPDDKAGYPSLSEIAILLLDRNTATFLKVTETGGAWEVDQSSAYDWEQLCNDQRIEPCEPEVYEHWIVSSWAKGKLAEHGERVGDIEGMTVGSMHDWPSHLPRSCLALHRSRDANPARAGQRLVEGTAIVIRAHPRGHYLQPAPRLRQRSVCGGFRVTGCRSQLAHSMPASRPPLQSDFHTLDRRDALARNLRGVADRVPLAEPPTNVLMLCDELRRFERASEWTANLPPLSPCLRETGFDSLRECLPLRPRHLRQ